MGAQGSSLSSIPSGLIAMSTIVQTGFYRVIITASVLLFTAEVNYCSKGGGGAFIHRHPRFLCVRESGEERCVCKSVCFSTLDSDQSTR